MISNDSNLEKRLNSRITRKILEFSAEPVTIRSDQIRLLLCLPFDYAHFYTALKVFLPVIRQYPEITRLVVPQALFPLIKEIESDLLIPLIVTQIDAQGFPTSQDIWALIGAKLSVAIDLNVVPTVTSAFIVARSQARIRAGFQTEYSEDLFNMIVSCKDENQVESTYQRLWNLVEPEISKTI